MTVTHNRIIPLLWGEDAPYWAWFGFWIVGALSTAMSIHLWLLAQNDIAQRPNSPVKIIEAPEPTHSPQAVLVPDSLPSTSEPQGMETSEPEDDTCPTLFSVAFKVGSDTPQLDSAELADFVTWLLAHPNAMLVIDGHADAVGSPGRNFALSQHRAQAVADRFEAAGIPASRITQRAFGYYAPLKGTSKESPVNRRVVLSVSGKTPCSNGEAP